MRCSGPSVTLSENHSDVQRCVTKEMQELKFSEAPKDQVIESLVTGVREKF